MQKKKEMEIKIKSKFVYDLKKTQIDVNVVRKLNFSWGEDMHKKKFASMFS